MCNCMSEVAAKAPSTSDASSFERHRLTMLFTPFPPRALARGGGVGVVVQRNRCQRRTLIEPPTPTLSSASLDRRFAGEKKRAGPCEMESVPRAWE